MTSESPNEVLLRASDAMSRAAERIDQLKNENAALAERIAGLERENESLRAECSNRVTTADKRVMQVMQLEADLSRAQAELKTALAQIEELKQENAMLSELLARPSEELAAAKRDAERIDWFEKQAEEGCCPALLNDDNGHWAVSGEGMQSCQDGDGPQDIETSFFVEAKDWKPTVREAIDAARTQDGETGS